ncbi:cell wall metabolism sensor histidine kinase WalK [bacterium]|nr:cell wall metabolism sensor histidine kinase WalK [bacterium]
MKKKTRIFWLLYRAYLLITLVSLLAVSWYISDSVKKYFLKQYESDLHVRGVLLARQVKPLLSPLDRGKLQRLCLESGTVSNTRITVILPGGEVVGDTESDPATMDNHIDRPEVVQALAKEVGLSIRYSGTLGKNMMYVAMSLKSGTLVKAILRMSVPLTAVDEEIKSIQIKIFFGGLVIAILASIVSWLVSIRISHPIENLKRGAVRFSMGDLDHRLAESGTVEFNGLADAMNQMATQLKERMNAITNQQNEYQTVLSNMLGGVIALDRQERIVSLNPSVALILKIDPMEFKGRSIQEAIRNHELNRFVSEAVSSDDRVERDIVIYHPEKRVINASSAPLFNADQDRTGTLLVLNDVSQLRFLENMRRDFAANVSHELKTPLTAIKGFVETLIDGAYTDPMEAPRFLEIIQRHVNRLNSIITDLLQLSKIETMDQRNEISFSREKIEDVIESALSACQAKAKAKEITIYTDYGDALEARVDSSLLQQAILNLMENALEYSYSSGPIEITARSEENWITIDIKDHGVGIETKHLDRLFERFYRVEKARTRKAGGTGLGLAIAKHIVQVHKGYITVKSKPGEGSTFSIHIPKT